MTALLKLTPKRPIPQSTLINTGTLSSERNELAAASAATAASILYIVGIRVASINSTIPEGNDPPNIIMGVLIPAFRRAFASQKDPVVNMSTPASFKILQTGTMPWP